MCCNRCLLLVDGGKCQAVQRSLVAELARIRQRALDIFQLSLPHAENQFFKIVFENMCFLMILLPKDRRLIGLSTYNQNTIKPYISTLTRVLLTAFPPSYEQSYPQAARPIVGGVFVENAG